MDCRAIGRRVVRWCFVKVVGYNRLFYKACRNYVEWYRGECNLSPKENGEYRLIEEVLPSAHVVFDIGAYVGDWTVHALRFNPNLTVHCFEPCHETCQILRKRLAHHSNVFINEAALGRTRGQATLHVSKVESSMNSLLDTQNIWGVYTGDQVCPVQSVDDYCAENGIEWIDFMKVDVEGYEWEVFAGAKSMLQARRVKVLQFEYDEFTIAARRFLRDYFDLFGDMGYGLYKVFPEGLRTCPRYDVRLEKFNYCNYVAALDGTVDHVVVNRKPV